ncbi:MAG: Ig-like domain-containing protein [Gallionella sp.]|nr:Ig-like domain-containing protein [Gallionella sp.]
MSKHTIKSVLVMLFSMIVAACGGGGATTASNAVPLKVTFTSPTVGATGVPINSVISVTFSEILSADTMTAAAFTLNNGATGTVAHSGGANAVTLTPAVNLASSTSYTATISGVKGITGNAMAAPYIWTFTTGMAPDNTPPAVLFTSPVNNATNVAVGATITATFSEAMTSSSISGATFTVDNGVTGTIAFNGITAAFTPAANLAFDTSYTATISSGTDVAGNAMAAPHTWTFTTIRPVPGTLDTTFNTTGKVITAVGPGDVIYTATGVALQPDGKIVVTGSASNGSDEDFALLRYNSDGSLDTTFNTTGMVITAIGAGHDVAAAIVIQPDGKIVVAGRAHNGFNNDFALLRYNPDGSLDTTFGFTGMVLTAIGQIDDLAFAVALQPDGKILVAGSTNNGVDWDIALARYNSGGSLDTTFNTTGKVITAVGSSNDLAAALTLQADGKIVVAGASWNGHDYDFTLLRYNSDGSLDTTFNATGKVINDVKKITKDDNAHGVALQPDGKILVAGSSFNGYDDDFALLRYNPDGSLDTTFNITGTVITDVGGNNDALTSIALQPDGKIVVAGYAYDNTTSELALVRYTPDGSLDTTFNATGKVLTDVGNNKDLANAVVLQPDGKIVAAGYASNGVSYDFALVRYWP